MTVGRVHFIDIRRCNDMLGRPHDKPRSRAHVCSKERVVKSVSAFANLSQLSSVLLRYKLPNILAGIVYAVV